MSNEWVALIQGTAFPITACVAMGIFISKTLKDYRVLVDKIVSDNNASRANDNKLIADAVKENTSATYELAKAVGELCVRLETTAKT